ncbi:MAG: hypothetical protein RCG15_00360 [Candidatus Rickettsia vulgarisii]
MAVIIIDSDQKSISSREAMNIFLLDPMIRTRWVTEQEQDLKIALDSLKGNDFFMLGEIVEKNAERLHSLLWNPSPSITYDLPLTKIIKQEIKNLRKLGTPVYFTQDAGPNIKIIFPENVLNDIKNFMELYELEYFII